MWRVREGEEGREGVQQDGSQARENGTIAESSLVMSGQTCERPECCGVLQMAERAESQ